MLGWKKQAVLDFQQCCDLRKEKIDQDFDHDLKKQKPASNIYVPSGQQEALRELDQNSAAQKKKAGQVVASVTRRKKQSALMEVLPHQHADLQLHQQLLLCHLSQGN